MISVILLHPKEPGNIGAVCRCMKNFGFSRLVLIEPKCSPLHKDAIARAKHGSSLLRNAQVLKKDCMNSFDYLIGTTSVVGTDYNIPRSPVSPEILAKLLQIVHGNIGIMFGRESTGITNKEILLCDFIVTIPATKEYPALNLSHSVSIILYELFKKSKKKKINTHFKHATRKEKVILQEYLEKLLSQMEFSTPQKKETQRRIWKRLIGKSFLTRREAYALIGFLRKLIR